MRTRRYLLEETKKVSHLRNLHTLVITEFISSGNSDFFLPNDSLKGTLRALDIELWGDNKCHVQEEIGGLVHLRYLTIGGGIKHVLPCSITKLHHLQVLRWSGAPIDTTGMTNLVNLHYMKLPFEMMQNIKEVGKLTSLQELRFFVGNEKGQHIDELKVLNCLRELSIEKIENVGDSDEAKNAELSKKESLNYLSLIWTAGSNPTNSEYIIDNLQPSPTLQNLMINHYRGHKSPNWMQKLLAVDNQRNLLPAKVQTLDLGNCGGLDVQLLESAARLSTLHELTISDSSSISCFPSSENVFPSLRELHIFQCDKLADYSLTEYARGVGPGNSMASLKINELTIPHLSLLFIEPFKSLKFVTRCGVEECSGMETLPEQWLLQNSSTLKYFTINDASSLQSLPDTLGRLSALEELRISNVISLEEVPDFPPLKITWAPSLHQASSDQASSDQASSDQASSDQASSDQASSDQASSDQKSSYKSFSDEAPSDQASPDQSSPDRL